MSSILRVTWLLVNADRRAMARGAFLSIAVLAMGAALLGLSGWFITATGLAGLAGIGIQFDVFRPSAGVRFLALGRAAARYGERLLTHDATLRSLAALRVVLLRGFALGDARELARLRSESALTRIVSDVDALDGVVLRLILPAAAALATHGLVFVGLGLIVGWSVAACIAGLYLTLGIVVLSRLARHALTPSSEAEDAGQLLRRGMIDMIRDREALIVSGTLGRKERRLRDIDSSARAATRRLDMAERQSAFLLSLVVSVAALVALVVGAALLDNGSIDPAKAVIGFFVALALSETLIPLKRGVSDLGRMVDAARRIEPHFREEALVASVERLSGAPLLTLHLPDATEEFFGGETVALTGVSGVGKSMLLMQIAGLVQSEAVLIQGLAPSDYSEEDLRQIVSMLPQRSSLITGSVRDNLSLSGEFSDVQMWSALETVCMAGTVRARDGLDTKLGEAGAGLSGGQSRRLALARNILKKSNILLLDEPTEGLDAETSDAVLKGVREALPDALIIATMHANVDHAIFDREIELSA